MSERRTDGVRAIALLSGGLDSELAACVLRQQGIEVHGVCFESPFFGSARAVRAAQQIGVPIRVVEFTADILSIIERPKHGFGSEMNPCIDCHAAMLRRAGDLMSELGARFLCTGEVLNQRPMSQNRRSLGIVARESGYPELVLRPLSARLLDETEPERRGWVDRARLLGIEGRSRKEQLELAAGFGLTGFVSGSGGCALTEPNMAGRLRELRDHEGLQDVRDVRLLRHGRHFRLAPTVKVVVGRDQADNEAIAALARPADVLLTVEGVPGPTGLLPAGAGEELAARAATVVARYADSPAGGPVTVVARTGGVERRAVAAALSREDADRLMIR